MKYGTLTSALVLGICLSGEAFAVGTFYVGEADNDYIITFGGIDAEHMVSYDDKARIDNESGKDSVVIRYATFEDLYDDTKDTEHSVYGSDTRRGGAVSSKAPITEVTSSVFRRNKAIPSSGYAYGGALQLQNSAGIISDSIFEENQAFSESSKALGGAIMSDRQDIAGISNSTFINNEAKNNSSSEQVWGGAIAFNGGLLNGIDDSTFIGNRAITTGSVTAFGGAIDLYSAGLDHIKGSRFEGNYAESINFALGGAISLSSYVYGGNELYADFEGNYAKSSEYRAYGGAVYIATTDYYPHIKGTYKDNYAEGKTAAYGGTIYNSNTPIQSIEATFDSNHVVASSDSGTVYAGGGAIYNNATIVNILSDSVFSNNYAQSHADASNNAYAYASIYNSGTIDNIEEGVLFSGNYTKADSNGGKAGAYGGAIYNTSTGTITKMSGEFENNYTETSLEGSTYAYGGAIYNRNIITSIENATFKENYVIGANANGGAIANSSATINKLVADFEGNHNTSPGDAWGGAIANFSGAINGLSSNFIGNWAKGDNAQGAAIDNYGTINMLVDGEETDGYKASVVFKDNYITKYDGSDKRYEAIYNGEDGTIIFEANKGGQYTFYDYINGEIGSAINFTGDDTGVFNLYNDIKNQDKVDFVNGYTLNMVSPADIRAGESVMNFIDAKEISIQSILTLNLDVNLKTREADSLRADTFNIADGAKIMVSGVKVLDEPEMEVGDKVEVPFIFTKVATSTNMENVETVEKTASKDDVFYYALGYKLADDGDDRIGNLVFEKTEELVPHPVEPEPEPEPEDVVVIIDPETGEFTVEEIKEMLVNKVSQTASSSAQTTVDALNTKLVNREVNKNLLSFKGIASGDDMIVTSWIETFGSQNDVKLKNLHGSIDTKFYGIVGGFDSKKFMYGNGIEAIYGIYGAVVGSKQKYGESRIKQHGEYLGASVAFRKGAFFSTVAGNVGYLHNEANTSFGKDKFETRVVSISNKGGVDIVDGKWTYTPSLYVGYTGVDSDDYTTKAKTRIENKFMHVFTLAPEMKLARDFEDGLLVYGKLGYKMFFYANNKVRANGIILQEMSVKPYVEYGLGLEKNWSKVSENPHDLTTYGEVVRHDGGRKGWDINLGLKLDL